MKLKQLLNESSFASQLDAQYPTAKISITEKPNHININMIKVDEKSRGKGTLRSIVQKITDHADRSNKTVGVEPTGEFGANKAKLEKFYKQMGFVKNSGKNKDFEINMPYVRQPRNN